MSSTDLHSVHLGSSSSPEAQPRQPPASIEQGVPKKKRNRMNKDQLAQLEHAFAMDRSPTGLRRRELSLQIGVPERQIQVWFQNRRAKARTNEEKYKKMRVLRVPSPVREPPELRQADQTDFAILIQEDDSSVFTIPCSTLSIGTWRRVNFEDCHELLAWICEKKRCLVWFIHSKDYSFKMQVPLDDLKEMLFKNADPGKAFLTIDISRPPSFFLRRNFRCMNGSPPVWRRCEDWTEQKAASRTLQHVLGGPALPLANAVTYIKHQIENAKQVHLYPVNYPAINLCPPPTSISPTYPSLSVDDGFYFNTAGRQLAVRSLDSQPCPENQPTPLYEIKSPLPPFQNYAVPTSETLKLHGTDAYTDPHTTRNKTRLVAIGGMGDASSDHPSPPLVPLKPPYPHTTHHPHPYHAAPGYHPSLPLPGLSELFAPSRDS